MVLRLLFFASKHAVCGVGVCVCWLTCFSFEVEERMNKLKLELEALSQSEQNAAKSQAVEKERVTVKCISLSTWSIKCILIHVNVVSINNRAFSPVTLLVQRVSCIDG